jgi:hypothetical protein
MRSRAPKPKRAASGREHDEHPAIHDSPSVPSMVRIVAITVTLIILISFAAGYGFGRLFL